MTCAAIRTKNPETTIRLGVRLGELLLPGDVIALTGDLGAGKTTFTKGVAQGAGVPTEVASPTFTLIHEHRGRLPFYHIDLYRIDTEDQIADLGLEEYIYSQGATIIEWSERMGSVLPESCLVVRLVATGDTEREIELKSTSPRWLEVIQELARFADTLD